jgi:hypothetical protein
MKVIRIILVCVILAILGFCKKYPGDIPDEAILSYSTKNYTLEDKINNNKRFRSWNQLGELQTETITTEDDVITRHYENGELFSERKYSELIKEKDKKPEIPIRPLSIPKSSFKSERLTYWVSVVKTSQKDKIIWKLWNDDGEKTGYCIYTEMEYNGYCRIYLDENTYVNHLFDRGKELSNIEIYTTKENMYKLSKKQQALVKITPDSDSMLEEKWSQLGRE